MLQQVMTNPGEIIFREVPVPEVKDDQVLVKIMNIGICGSDIHVYHGKHPFTKYPVTQGHEVSGEIAKVGKDVTEFHEGQKVTIEPQVYCGQCYPCRHGKYNLCEELKVMGFQTTGTASEYFAVDASKVTPIPEDMSYEEGAMIEPLAVGFHAAKQGGAAMGQTAVVTGSGCIGLVTMMALKALGVDKVYVVDIMQKRLDKAIELGATGVINGREKNTVEELLKLTNGRGVDLAIDTTRKEICVKQGMEALVKGGTQVLVGYSASGDMNLPTSLICDKEITIKSVFRYRHIYPLAIQAVAEGKVNLKGIVTNIFELDDIQNAMDKSVNEKADIVKSVVKIS